MEREAETTGAARRRDTAGVIAPPPVLLAGALILGLLLHRVVPLPVWPGGSRLLQLTGAASIVFGLTLSAAVVWAFRKVATPVTPMQPARRLVCTGPYRYSRNPDYIGQMLMYVGAALIGDTWWPLLLLPLVIAAIQRGVVEREERYLEAKFGQQYREYRARVPRWWGKVRDSSRA